MEVAEVTPFENVIDSNLIEDEYESELLDALDLDFDDLDIDIKQHLEENTTQKYADDIETQLTILKQESTMDYINETTHALTLHDHLHSCDEILGKMVNLLSGFQQDLGSISSAIDTLQNQSNVLSVHLKNRKAAESRLSMFIEDVIVSPDIIKQICYGEVNENYLELLVILNNKIMLSESFKSIDCPNIDSELQKLTCKAVAKVREFLLQKIYSLRKPKTNVQIMQQTLFIKYSYLNKFLYMHGNRYAHAVKNVYVETVSKIFTAYFKAYMDRLAKLQYEIATKTDLLGSQETQSKGKKGGVFSLQDRANVLYETTPSIIPHVAEQQHLKYSYEAIFKSFNQIFIDTVSGEYLFVSEFFSEMDPMALAYGIFEKVIALLVENVEAFLANSYDLLGMLVVFCLTQQHFTMMKRRRIFCLNSYFEKIQKSILSRFSLVFQNNVDSVKKLLTSNLGSTIDIRPHYITRRYAEFVASVMSLNVHFGEYETTVKNLLMVLKNYMETLLTKLAATLGKKKKTVFLISNYDLILGVLEEREITSEEAATFRILHSMEIKNFVEEELETYFQGLIEFVQKSDVNIHSSNTNANPTEPKIDTVLAEKLAKAFAANWKTAIDSIQSDVMSYFSNFRTGSDILKQVLTQLMLYYSRFEDIIKKTCKNAPFRKDLVSISTLRFEIQKKLSDVY